MKKGGKMNVLIRTLIIGDAFIFFGTGITAPIFAIYLNDQIIGGSIATAGIASTIYLLTKAAVQLPVSKYTDSEKGNKREAITLLIGYGMFIAVPLGFLLATNIWHIFAIEILYGIGAAVAYPGWVAIFTKFADKKKEGYEWSLFSTTSSIAMALAGGIGGIIGELWGFDVLFIIMATFSIISFLIYAILFSRYQEYLYNGRH